MAPRATIALATLGTCLALLLPANTFAQNPKRVTDLASAVVGSLGNVTAVSPLAVRQREQQGNVYVAGTVTTIHNGAQQLQVRMGAPLADSVYARNPVGAYVLLNTTTWVTIFAGPGAKSTTTTVDYFVVWAKNTPKNPQNATSIPVTYRVIP